MAKEPKNAEGANAPETNGNDTINLADVESQVKAMLEETKAEAVKIIADAKAEAEKILADAKVSASGELSDDQKEKAEEEKAYYDELVEVELFKDNDRYKDDVFVAVNGVGCIIQRGKKVMVKRKYALALGNARKQNESTANYIDLKTNEGRDADSKL